MAVVALIHDVTLPAGVFAILGHYYGVEVDSLVCDGASYRSWFFRPRHHCCI